MKKKKNLWSLINNINMKKFVWRKCEKIIFVFHFGIEFLEYNLFSSAGSCFFDFPNLCTMHVFHILNQNYVLLLVLIFAPFCSSYMVSSVARIKLCWINAAILVSLEKTFLKLFFKIFIIILHDTIGLENFLLSFNLS